MERTVFDIFKQWPEFVNRFSPRRPTGEFDVKTISKALGLSEQDVKNILGQ